MIWILCTLIGVLVWVVSDLWRDLHDTDRRARADLRAEYLAESKTRDAELVQARRDLEAVKGELVYAAQVVAGQELELMHWRDQHRKIYGRGLN